MTVVAALPIEECGFKPDLVKDDPTSKAIIERVLTGIRRAHFVVADFTGRRPSVNHEVGFAHGIGKEVICCCREDHEKDLPFDTRHLGHVVWKDEADLKTKLIESIKANIISIAHNPRRLDFPMADDAGTVSKRRGEPFISDLTRYELSVEHRNGRGDSAPA